ncbi:ABC-type glycerol-3-phosphate transport system substrate-binding protein [Paenibacillus sp. DS2015]|uniref:ABC transporter substrate-binding protein n=1 Tax=Paenibacillus sp. DS2015 TaxID=3373917 RepID=UPI003D208CB9
MRKWIVLLTVVGMTFSLVACAGQKSKNSEITSPAASEAKEPVTIQAWFPPVLPEARLKELTAAFNAQSPDVKVEMTVLDWEKGREKIKTGMISGDGPDVFYLANGLDQAYIDGKVLASAADAGISEERLAQFDPLSNMNSIDGNIYALPLNFDVSVLYYRKDMLKEAGFDNPPTTWEELKSMSKAISKDTNGDGKPDVMGFQLKGADDHLNAINFSWQSMLAASGGSYINAEGKSGMNSPEGIEALNYLQSFYTEGISTVGPSSVTGFAEGKIAMFFFVQNVGDVNKWSENADLTGKWGMAPMPKGPNSSASYVGGHGIGINAGSKDVKAAGKFVEWFASPENSVDFMDNGMGIPPYNLDKIDAATKQKIQEKIDTDKENWDAIYAQLAASSPDLSIQGRVGYSARWDAQKVELLSTIIGDVTPEEALSNLDKRINQAIGK